MVDVGEYVTIKCVDKHPYKLRGLSITSGWQWAHSWDQLVTPTSTMWQQGPFNPSEASMNGGVFYVYLSPLASSKAGDTGTLTVGIYPTSAKDNDPPQSTLQLIAVRTLTSANLAVSCTENVVTIATSSTGTVTCELKGINVASSASVTVNSITVSSPVGWTITRSPSSGSLTGATPFTFTLSLTPVCGAAGNPPAPNVTITSQLTFMSNSFTGPSTSITAKHGATSNVSASITGSSLQWSRTYSFAPQSVAGSLTYQVVASGCAGWNIQVSATALNYAGTASGSPIASSSISVTPGAPSAVSGSTASVSPGTPGTLGAPVKVLSATENNGIGTYNQTLGIGIAIPGAARVGTYTSTITIAAASGP